jgi:hypothetical protein
VTFKALKKRVTSENTIQQQSKLFEICKDNFGFEILKSINYRTSRQKEVAVLITLLAYQQKNR